MNTCRECGIEFDGRRRELCGNRKKKTGCAYKYSTGSAPNMGYGRGHKKCEYCEERLWNAEPNRKYHGDINTVGSCAYEAHRERLRKYIRKQPQKVYIVCREALNSGYF